MDRSKFPDPIVVTDFQPRGLATVLQVLRIGTDRSELENPIASADRGFTLDHGVRTYHGVGPDPDLRPNYRARADPNHPYYPVVFRAFRSAHPRWPADRGWFVHPFGLTVLRRMLDDATETGLRYEVEGRVLREYAGAPRSSCR